MSIGIEVKVTKYTCVVCRKVYFVENPDWDEPPLGAYLEGMGHWGSGGGPITAFVDQDCLATSLADIVAAMYDLERHGEELVAATKPLSVAKVTTNRLVAVPKAGKPWTAKDKKAVMASSDIPALAEKLGRTEQSVHSMRWKLQREKDGKKS